MSLMVERVACALYENQTGGVWRSNGCITRPYLEMARVAMAAMRNPTIPMLNHVRGGMTPDQDPKVYWQAMIDEAMK